MNVEKVTINDDKLIFENSGKTFTLRGDVLKMITVYKYNATDSSDVKLIIFLWLKFGFDIHSRSKSLRDKNLIKNSFNKRGIPASGLKTIFVSENPNELCDELKLLLQKKRAGSISNIIIEEIVVTVDKLIEYRSITTSQHQKKLSKKNIYKIFFKTCDYIR